jgi:FAD/FMN-containing dehydrogenase
MLILPATPDVVAGFMAAADAAPDALSAIANVMPCPPMPFVPAEHHGRVVVFALVCHSGAPGTAESALAPFRALADPIVDQLRPIEYPEIYPPDDPDYRPLAISRTMFVDTFDRALAAIVLEHLEASTSPMRVAQLRVLGGAMARVPADATAFAHRDRRIMANVAAFYAGPEDRAEKEAWVDGLGAVLRGSYGAYVNFLGDEGAARVREAYPGRTWDRLATVKRRYDPENLFRLNQNVPPAA